MKNIVQCPKYIIGDMVRSEKYVFFPRILPKYLRWKPWSSALKKTRHTCTPACQVIFLMKRWNSKNFELNFFLGGGDNVIREMKTIYPNFENVLSEFELYMLDFIWET